MVDPIVEPPPGVAELMKLYEGIEDVYRLALTSSAIYEELSETASSTDIYLYRRGT
jgi:hypothetical protein